MRKPHLLQLSPSDGQAGPVEVGIAWQDWMAIASLAVSVLGFGFTLWQVRKSVNASEAAQKAATVVGGRLAAARLMVLAVQLQKTETELEEVSRLEEVPSIERALVKWRHLAASAVGLLQSMESAELIETERVAANALIKQATKALKKEGDNRPPYQRIQKATGAIAAITADVTRKAEAVVASQQLEGEEIE